jgi:hypothetical protein
MVSLEHLSDAPPVHRLRPRRRGGFALSPKYLSFAIVALALYGDLVKRVFSPSTAVFVLYGAASVILVAMVKGGRKGQTTPVSTLAGLLIAVYVAQLFTSFPADMMDAFEEAAYVCIPLAFLIVLPRAYPEFDLRALASYTMVLMIPVHVVGLIQQFVSSSFMISTAYSGDLGGVIERNFLDGGSFFQRFPSIFASADRYSGVAMMQIVLTPILLIGSKLPMRKTLVWVMLNLIAGGVSLLIAGARSRIIIVSVTLFAAGIVFLIGVVRRRLTVRLAISLRVFVAFVIGLAVVISAGSIRQHVAALPVLTMLGQTIEHGDIVYRFKEAIDLSQIPEDVTFFGEGLGVVGGGRPGELAIRAMWIEGGLFWTLIMLMIHTGFLLWLGRTPLLLALSGNALLAPLAIGQLLAWLFAVIAGLSSTFELSQALLLFPTIAAFSMMTFGRSTKARRRVPTMIRPGLRVS